MAFHPSASVRPLSRPRRRRAHALSFAEIAHPHDDLHLSPVKSFVLARKSSGEREREREKERTDVRLIFAQLKVDLYILVIGVVNFCVCKWIVSTYWRNAHTNDHQTCPQPLQT